MNKDLLNAQTLMLEKKATLALVNKDQEEVYFDRGVKPLLMLIDSAKDYSEFSASDRVIGKAAALLYLNLKIKNIYCDLISEKALEVFKKNNINIEYKKVVPLIQNRDKTGFCPMETLVLEIDDSNDAYIAIKNKIKEMSK